MGKRAERRARRERREETERELAEIRARLDGAYSVFDHAADPEVVEAAVLEIGALLSRYGRAVRALKAIAAEEPPRRVSVR